MNILTLDGKKVFDGSEVEFEKKILFIEFNNHKYDFPAKELKPISELVNFSQCVKPNEISLMLGFKVLSLGNMNVFHGRKKGLKLYFYVSQMDNRPLLMIFSLGEYQLGRVMCFFESAIEI